LFFLLFISLEFIFCHYSHKRNIEASKRFMKHIKLDSMDRRLF
jgi:hypothetical protein